MQPWLLWKPLTPKKGSEGGRGVPRILCLASNSTLIDKTSSRFTLVCDHRERHSSARSPAPQGQESLSAPRYSDMDKTSWQGCSPLRKTHELPALSQASERKKPLPSQGMPGYVGLTLIKSHCDFFFWPGDSGRPGSHNPFSSCTVFMRVRGRLMPQLKR